MAKGTKASAKSTSKTPASKKASSKRGAKAPASKSKPARKTEAATAKSSARASKRTEAPQPPVAKPVVEKEPPKPAPVARPAGPPPPQIDGAPDNSILPTTFGRITVFGGPRDRSLKPDDKLSLPTGPHFAYELVRTLNPKSFYCSMRFDYRINHMSPEEGKRWWANRKLVMRNPKTGESIVVKAVDYGPHENTGFDVGVSPAVAEALGLEGGDEVQIYFADPRTPLGPPQ